MNLQAVPSSSAFGRRYSTRTTKRAHKDRSDSVSSLQNSSFSYKTPPTSLEDTTRKSANRVVRKRLRFLSHKTEVLSGTARHTAKSLPKEDGNPAYGSPPDGYIGPSTQLMLEAERALGFDCEDRILSGDRSKIFSSLSLTEATGEVQEEHEGDRLPRRSARLGINGKATEAVRLSSTAPKKRQRISSGSLLDTMKHREKEKKKISSRTRRTDLVSPATENRAAAFARPLEKHLEETAAARSESEQLIAKGSKTRAWLTQGLYVGEGTDPRLEKVFGKRSYSYSPQRNLFLTPLFAGARLLELDRDFKLPFDVFDALPRRGQPNAEDWKKLHKSKSDLIHSILKRFR